MSSYVVTVDFRIKSDKIEAFRRLVTENARDSLKSEPGCQQFDVVVPEGQPDRVFLYERYTNEAAFEAHKKTPHFLQFDRGTADIVESKTIMTGTRHHPSNPE